MASNTSSTPATAQDGVYTGTSAADSLSGSGGSDTLIGGAGNDVLAGDGPVSGQWAYQVYNYDFSSAGGQAGQITNGTLAGQGYVTDFGVRNLITNARGVAPSTDANDYGVILTSTLNVTSGGSYRFTTRSDDGSTITIRDADGNALTWANDTGGTLPYMNNDFHQSPTTRGGSVNLQPGQTYTIEVRYWENGGGEAMSATISGPDTGNAVVDLASSPMVGTPPELAGQVDGNDSLSGDAGDDVLSGGGGNDVLDGGIGNDRLDGGNGADVLAGGTGNDTLIGGAGSDLLQGDPAPAPATTEFLNWRAQGADGTNIAGGFTQVTGEVQVSVTTTSTGNNNPTFTVETDAQYTGGGPMVNNSSGFLFGTGNLDTADVTMNFSAAPGSDYPGEVQNVTFRVNDIDWGANNHRDQVTVTAFDAAGNAVAVDLTPGTGDTLSGATVTGNSTSQSSADEAGSLLVNIPGPVARIVVSYRNAEFANTHAVNITNVHFQTLPPAGGDDSLDGGAENDTLDGGGGADSLLGGDGNDSLNGGADNDTLSGDQGDDLLLGGTGDDSLIGGDGSDTLAGGAGADSLTGGGGMDFLDYTASDAGVAIDLTGNTADGGHATGDVLQGGLDGILGSGFDDTLAGFDGQGADFTNVFFGNAGNDLLDGRGGDDSLFGGDDADTILGGAGNDTLSGDAGDDLLIGDAGADQMDGGAGNDLLLAGSGDTVTAGAGDDLIVLDSAALTGGPITIDGGEGEETGGDTLNFAGLLEWDDITLTSNDPGNLAGSATLADGSVVTFSNIETLFICYVAGTRILTPQGLRRVETLRPGDLVLTRDHGPQPLRWTGSNTLRGDGAAAPIRFDIGTLGNHAPLYVSPQHRMLHVSPQAALYFGASEVFVTAKHMVNGTSIRIAEQAVVGYFHLMFDRHEVIFAEGAAAESFHPGKQGLRALSDAARADLFTRFPALRADPDSYGPTARPCLKSYEAQVLAASRAIDQHPAHIHDQAHTAYPLAQTRAA